GASIAFATVIFRSDSAALAHPYDMGRPLEGETIYVDASGDEPVLFYEGFWGPYVYYDISVLRNAWETEIDGQNEIRFEYCKLVLGGEMVTGLIANSGYDYHHPAQGWDGLYIEREDNGTFDIISTVFDPYAGTWSDPQEVFTSFGNERHPVADRLDNLAFEVDWSGNTDIAYWHPGLTEAELVSNDPGEDRNPCIVRTMSTVYLFWESNRDGNWNIYYAYRDAVGVEPEPGPEIPQEFTVSVHPNPGNAQFSIDLELPVADIAEITIYNTAGRLVDTINQSWLNAGKHAFRWQPEHQPSGIYFIRIATSQSQKTAKLVYLK
ncbi:MAG: T9SS type A sorting domain-containing protein, partial [bacterium]